MNELNSYDEIIESRFHNKPIHILAAVTGKTIVPYHIPKIVRIKCLTENCRCSFKEETDVEIEPIDQRILLFLDAKTSQFLRILKEVLGITCKSITYEVKEMQLIDRIYIDRPTGKERSRRGGGTRPAYVVSTNIETNYVYEFEGYTTTEPVTQLVTHVFTKATKVNSDIESFSLTVTKHRSLLNEFCINDKNPENLYEQLEKLYNSYAYNITKIYERFDLHLCVDLLFRSVISFYFDNEYVHKGWLEAMIIGDTRCGKGYVAEKLVDFFGLGEVVSGENSTYAGLIGGLQQFNKHWVVTWGKIPLNDCGLVVIDETSGLMEDIWGKLSRVRSEGIAEITKIRSETANARTRLLFICNPPTRTISSYSYGIQSILELIKSPEDIARFDYVLVVAHDEVSGELINKRRENKVSLLYNKNLEQDLILWCWSRKPNEVRFTKDAIKLVYEISKRLESTFDFSIPLIQVENIRFKIAKLAIAFAARFYSNANDGKVLLIKRVHVECAYGFFHLIYGKEVSGYVAYSTMKKSASEIVTPEKLKEVELYFDSWKLQKQELLRCLLINNNIIPDDIVVHLGVRKEDGNECISRLLKTGCLTKKGNYYVKTPEFNSYLKRKVL